MAKKTINSLLIFLIAFLLGLLKPAPALAFVAQGFWPSYPTGGTTVNTPYPTFYWWQSHPYLYWTNFLLGTSCGNFNYYGAGSGWPSSYTVPTPLSGNTTYYWTIYGFDGSNYWDSGSNWCQSFRTPSFCSGSYGNCTGWGSCSASCGGGVQYRTCYDTGCGTPQTQSQSCNTQSCCTNSAPAPISLSSPANGATSVTLSPTLAWNAESNWGTNCSGNSNTYRLYFGTSASPPLAASNLTAASYNTGGLAANTTYYWYVVASNGYTTSSPSQTWSFTTNAPPAINSVSISSSPVVANNTAQYTITAQASDPNSGGDIYGEYTLINYQGENGGAYRGYLTWGLGDYWSGYQDHTACSGGGYAVIQPGYGNTYLHLKSCSVSVSGNSRTVNFAVTFDPSFTGPADNDISGYVWDSVGNANGWVNFQTNFSVCPAAVPITGTISGIPAGSTATAYANTLQSNAVSAPSGNYTINAPVLSSYQIFASQISGYSYTPGPTTVSTAACTAVSGPAIVYTQNACPQQPDTNLIAVYHLDETSGQTAADSSGNNHNGAVTGTTIVAGKYGNARSFSNTSDSVQTNNPIVTGTGDFSVTAWINPSSAGAGSTRYITGNYGLENTAGIELYLSTANTFGVYFGSNLTGSGTLTANTWNQVALTRNNGTMTLYINGVPTGSGNLNGNVKGKLNWAIGNGPDYTSERFQGTIDEVRIWNRALTASEIGGEYQTLCATGVKVNCSPYSSCQNPRGTDITCGTGYQYRTCYDSGNSTPIDATPQACVLQPNTTISGLFMNVPDGTRGITVTGQLTNTPTGGSCPATIQSSPPSTTNYSLTSPALCTYQLSPTAISNYTVSPSNLQIAFSCTNLTGPTFWYNSDAGAGAQNSPGQTSPLYYGSGAVSQAGTAPGYRLENYLNSAPLGQASYSQILSIAIKNSGLTTSQNPCTAPGGRLDLTNYTIFCYNNSFPFDSTLNNAIANGPASPTVILLYPDPSSGNAQQTISSAKSITNKTLVVFVNGSLEVQNNVTIDPSYGSGAIFVLNNPDVSNPATSGNLLVDSPVSRLDGVFDFPGFSYDTQGGGNTGTKLVGYGSLLSIGGQALNLNRTFDSTVGPAEEWYYQPKYLKMYQNVISSPRFLWQELTPQ